jgi:hypothetical protein
MYDPTSAIYDMNIQKSFLPEQSKVYHPAALDLTSQDRYSISAQVCIL